MGDVHGALTPLRALLTRAGLIGAGDAWTGGDATLVFLGDLMDRGPDGAGVLRLVRSLEEQAAAAGGRVECLLGNHEVMLLAALRFGRRGRGGRLGPGDPYGLFRYWQDNGGRRRDLEALSSDDVGWLLRRPALLRAGEWLLLHADCGLYLTLGESVEDANARMNALLHASTPEVWGALMSAFAERGQLGGGSGALLCAQLLGTFGGRWLAHGHTPLPLLWPPDVSAGEPLPSEGWPYPHGRALALDGGLASLRGAGFLTRLDPHSGPQPAQSVGLS